MARVKVIMSKPRIRVVVVLVVVLALLGGATVWWMHGRGKRSTDALTLYGNIDIRTVDLAFNDSGRVEQIAFEEGSRVRKGEILARLDPIRFEAAASQAQAVLDAQQQQLALLVAGNWPQQIAGARAVVAGARATLGNAQASYDRQRALARTHMVSQQSADDALQALKNARANLQSAQQALSLQVAGSRKEQIAGARAQVQADQAALALARRMLDDTVLRAPDDGVIQTRILEVGDMASPATPVVTLALNNPVWVRAYVPETELGKITSGMRAEIISDSFPGRHFSGWIGFISPTAEFTPKSVQTTELRAELVYRVRIYACNPQDKLRMGMPVTVQVPLTGNAARVVPSDVCKN